MCPRLSDFIKPTWADDKTLEMKNVELEHVTLRLTKLSKNVLSHLIFSIDPALRPGRFIVLICLCVCLSVCLCVCVSVCPAPRLL